jgi:BioD-like phosphotransacetylase family protein
LKVEKGKLEKDKSKLQEKLDKFKIYHTYMEKVLEAGEEFGEMRDIIARYDTLTATHAVSLITSYYFLCPCD